MARRMWIWFLVCGSLVAPPGQLQAGNEKASILVLKLLSNPDKDFRAAGLDVVRDGLKGHDHTQRFAGELPKLDAAGQVALLSALAGRGDRAARPAVLELLKSTHDENVRAAALAALGNLGEPKDLPRLVEALSSKSTAEQSAARRSLVLLRGSDVSSAVATELNAASPAAKAGLIEVLAARRDTSALPAIIEASRSDSPQVRSAAMNALGAIGRPDQLAAMLPGVLKAAKGGERDAAEKNVALVCARIDHENDRADALTRALEKVRPEERDELLPLAGRVGGKKLINFVGDIATGPDAERRKQAVAALGKWPDASVADKLLEIYKKTADPAERDQAFQAYVKIAATRDRRSDRQRLDRMQQAMKLAQTPQEQALVLNRARTAYDIDTLRFVLPYIDQPKLAPTVCETIVELAHHREIRDPNKAEFDKALDKVIATSKNATVVDRAKRYQRGETWSRQ